VFINVSETINSVRVSGVGLQRTEIKTLSFRHLLRPKMRTIWKIGHRTRPRTRPRPHNQKAQIEDANYLPSIEDEYDSQNTRSLIIQRTENSLPFVLCHQLSVF